MSAFKGFDRPAQNFSKLPHKFIEQLPTFETMAEMKVVIYLLRHTWGYSEYGKPKRITTDEFMRGRKKKDGSRMDHGTGLTNNSVIDGLSRAIAHGFIVVETDDTDKARIEKYYCLNMSGVQTLHTGAQELHSYPQELHSDYAESAQRSEKETKETNKEKEKEEEGDYSPPALWTLYQNNITMITPLIADAINKAEKEYSFEWVRDAIELAGRNGAKSWNYCEAVLKRWKQEGRAEKRNGKKVTAAQSGDHTKYLTGEYAEYVEH